MAAMCGRFSLTASREEVEALLGAMIEEDFPPLKPRQRRTRFARP